MTGTENIVPSESENQNGITINVDFDEIWENIRDYEGEAVISLIPINDELLDFEETKIINDGKRIGLITKFYPKRDLTGIVGVLGNPGLIETTIKEFIDRSANADFRYRSMYSDRSWDDKAPDDYRKPGFHLSVIDCDSRAVITLEPLNQEKIDQAVVDWEKNNTPPIQGKLSNREYQPLISEYIQKLQEFKGEITISKGFRYISLDATIDGVWIYKGQRNFNEALGNYITAYKITLQAIYKSQSLSAPILKVNFSLPKPIKEASSPSEIMVDENQKIALDNEEAKKEGFDAIAGQDEAVAEAKKLVQAIKHPEIYKRRGIKIPKGILFYGPPGTGKTTLAKAIAEESEARFVEVSVADIGSKWHGESEKMLQAIFDSAGTNGKTILFFDEFDAFAPQREISYEITRKLIAVFNSNMDGVRSNDNVTVIAATNRPEGLDLAAKRSGRFDKMIEVPLPDSDKRIAIIKKYMEKASKAASDREVLFLNELDFEEISRVTNGLSGADLENLVNQVLETKLSDELKGNEWTPVNTTEMVEMANKIILSRTEKVLVKFDR